MSHQENDILKILLEAVEARLRAERLPEIPVISIEDVAGRITAVVRSILAQAAETLAPLSRVLSAEDLSADHLACVCTMASHLAKKNIMEGTEALAVLAAHGFEVREFSARTFQPHDPSLREAPNEWLFSQISHGAISAQTATLQDIIMICEVRPKPDVIDDKCWIQQPYANDPFTKELAMLHRQLDSYKPEKRINPSSRAGFTFCELSQHVLPALSERAGVEFQCMSALYACALVNDHPEMSHGRSTEWRGDKMGENHALISGRSDRGPLRYLYYDVVTDPYPNRGFRLCVVLNSSASVELNHSSPPLT